MLPCGTRSFALESTFHPSCSHVRRVLLFLFCRWEVWGSVLGVDQGHSRGELVFKNSFDDLGNKRSTVENDRQRWSFCILLVSHYNWFYFKLCTRKLNCKKERKHTASTEWIPLCSTITNRTCKCLVLCWSLGWNKCSSLGQQEQLTSLWVTGRITIVRNACKALGDVQERSDWLCLKNFTRGFQTGGIWVWS